MAKEGLQQLKRLFGDDVVTEEGANYVIHFPKNMPESDSFLKPSTSFDRLGREDEDDGGLLDDDVDTKTPPNEQVARIFKQMGAIKPREMSVNNTTREGRIELTKYTAEQPRFIDMMDKLEDGHFMKFTLGSEPVHKSNSVEDRALIVLNALRDDVKWNIVETAGERAFVTDSPVENAQGVMFHIMETLNVGNYQMLPRGKVAVSVPASAVTEANIHKLEALNPMKVKPFLRPYSPEKALG